MTQLGARRVQPKASAKMAKLKLAKPLARKENFCKGSAGQDLRLTKLNVFPARRVPSVCMGKTRSASKLAPRARNWWVCAKRALRLPSPAATHALWDHFVAGARRRSARQLAVRASISKEPAKRDHLGIRRPANGARKTPSALTENRSNAKRRAQLERSSRVNVKKALSLIPLRATHARLVPFAQMAMSSLAKLPVH